MMKLAWFVWDYDTEDSDPPDVVFENPSGWRAYRRCVQIVYAEVE
jgi:hypothetical protein